MLALRGERWELIQGQEDDRVFLGRPVDWVFQRYGQPIQSFEEACYLSLKGQNARSIISAWLNHLYKYVWKQPPQLHAAAHHFHSMWRLIFPSQP